MDGYPEVLFDGVLRLRPPQKVQTLEILGIVLSVVVEVFLSQLRQVEKCD